MTRIRMSSSLPPRKPAIAPMTVPTRLAKIATIRPMNSDTRPPQMICEYRSKFFEFVPNQASLLGGLLATLPLIGGRRKFSG